MDHDREPDWTAIERFLAGEASAEETLQVSRWARASAANDALLRRLEAAWTAEGAAARSYDSRRAWSQMQERMYGAGSAAEPIAPAPARRRFARSGSLVRRAALIALLVGAGVVAVRLGPARTETAELIAVQVSTGVGQRATVRLGDGSVVTLGPQSTLREAAGSRRERRVELNGSAHFDVVRDTDRPFVVLAGPTETRVLGTSFGIRGYGGSSVFEVVVETGRVSVRADSTREGVVLNPGQLGTVEPDGSVSVRSDVDVAQRLSWRDGQLAFDNAPLRAVAAEIERWYGIEVAIADSSLATYPLTATFTGASITEVLTVTSRSLGIRHSFDGKTAEFRP